MNWELVQNFIQLLIIPLGMSLGLIFTLMTGFAYLSWIERRVLGKFTMRLGPNRAGPFGFMQPAADGIKMIFKEELMPAHVEKRVYLFAPIMAVATAMLVWAVIPITSRGFQIFQFTLPAVLADVNVGLLYIIAITSLGSYGVVLAGWASNNKYSLLGALRTSAQLISYELPLGITLGTVVVITGSMSIVDIVNYQAVNGWLVFFPYWRIDLGLPFFEYLLIPLFFSGIVAFFTFFTASLAEAGRAPFDLPESENELVSGFMTEYGSMRFSFFMMTEYIHMITVSALATILFLGGWHGPFATEVPLLGLIYFILKLSFFLFVIIWIRTSITRLRYDTLMAFCWKFMLPLTLINLVVVSVIVVAFNL